MDVIELNMLSGLEDKRARHASQRKIQTDGVNRIAAYQPDGSAPAVATTPAEDMGIVNRSPTTNNHNHYYPAPVVEPATPPVNPWPWIFVSVLVIALACAAYWWAHRPQPAAPTTPATPGLYGLGLDDLKVF